MQQSITLQKHKVPYTVRKSKRAKRMRLAVYCDGSVIVTLPYRAKENIIAAFIEDKKEWILDKLCFYKKFKNASLAHFGEEDYLKHKDKAYNLAQERVEYFNRVYNFSFNKITIKNQKTRWGSCSRKGNLNFNYKILFLPDALRDYVIVHELCHLREFNHSRRFWNLVSKSVLDHSEIKRELKKNGLSIQ